MPKRLKKAAQDENQAAYSAVERIIQMSESDTADSPPSFQDQFRAHMARLGRKGGQISGAKRMENLTPEKRRKIASDAAQARWAKKKKSAKKR